MNERPSTEQRHLPWPLRQRVDQACDRFEAAWRAGEPPRIEPYLADSAEPERTTLLAELLRLEFEYRVRRGQRPTAEEYRERFPGDRSLVDAVFRQFAPVETGAKPTLSEVSGEPTIRVVLEVIEGPH